MISINHVEGKSGNSHIALLAKPRLLIYGLSLWRRFLRSGWISAIAIDPLEYKTTLDFLRPHS